MTREEALRILECLADGCSPLTGEVLPMDHLCLEEQVIEALVVAMEALQGRSGGGQVQLSDEEVRRAAAALEAHGKRPTANQLAGFMSGEAKFKDEAVLQDPEYGRFGQRHSRHQLRDWLEKWLAAHPEVLARPERVHVVHPFFSEPSYNRLGEKARVQLQEKLAMIPLQKVADLPEHVVEKRKAWPRYMEPWSEEELRLLQVALGYTNDAAWLAGAFGRSENSITAQAERFLPSVNGGSSVPQDA